MTSSAVILLDGIMFLGLFGQIEKPADDPILQLDAHYLRECDVIRNDRDSDRREFHEQWLSRFDAVLAENPESPYAVWGMSRKVGLLNSLGRFRESISILEKLLADEKNDDFRLALVSEIGGVSKAAWYVSKDCELAQKAMDSYRELLRKTGRSTAAGLKALDNMAEIETDAFGNHVRAAELYLEVVAGLDELINVDRARIGDYPNAAHSLAEASVEYAKADQVERSLEVFRQLEAVGQPQRVWVQQLIGMIRGPSTKEGTRALVDFAREWIEAHPNAEQADKLWYEFGWQHMQLGEADKAVPAFEKYLQLVNPTDPKTSAGTIRFATDYVQEHREKAGEKVNGEFPDAPPSRLPAHDQK